MAACNASFTSEWTTREGVFDGDYPRHTLIFHTGFPPATITETTLFVNTLYKRAIPCTNLLSFVSPLC